MAVTACPTCDRPLVGLGTYCWGCMAYVDDLRPEAQKKSVPAVDTRTEAEIQQATKKAVELLGFSWWDLSQPRATMQTEGLPDLFIMGRGVSCWVELKSAKGKQTPAQERFQRAVEANGGLYVLAHSEVEVVEILTHLASVRT